MILFKLTSGIKRLLLSSMHRQGNSDATFFQPFLLFRIPRYLKDDHLRLRPVSILDSPLMSDGLKNKDVLGANGLKRPISGSWLEVWWRLKRTYALLYCIEVDSRGIGFLGLYNMDPGESAEASLVIFNRRDRRRGHGSRAFTVLTESLRKYPLTKRIIVRVRPDNHAALSFWSKLGFEEIETRDETCVMSVSIDRKFRVSVIE
jgi:RimJ/RimL family protein N-acetyltransferase